MALAGSGLGSGTVRYGQGSDVSDRVRDRLWGLSAQLPAN
jgi:hypothetical protein